MPSLLFFGLRYQIIINAFQKASGAGFPIKKTKMELVTYSMTPKMAFSILFDALQYY